MSATISAELSTHVLDKSLSSRIAELLRERGGRWQETAQDLVTALRLNLTPRSLSVKLDQMKSELNVVGVSIQHKKVKGRKVLE